MEDGARGAAEVLGGGRAVGGWWEEGVEGLRGAGGGGGGGGHWVCGFGRGASWALLLAFR